MKEGLFTEKRLRKRTKSMRLSNGSGYNNKGWEDT